MSLKDHLDKNKCRVILQPLVNAPINLFNKAFVEDRDEYKLFIFALYAFLMILVGSIGLWIFGIIILLFVYGADFQTKIDTVELIDLEESEQEDAN